MPTMNDFRDWERDREARARSKPHLRLHVRVGTSGALYWRVLPANATNPQNWTTKWHFTSGQAIRNPRLP